MSVWSQTETAHHVCAQKLEVIRTGKTQQESEEVSRVWGGGVALRVGRLRPSRQLTGRQNLYRSSDVCFIPLNSLLSLGLKLRHYHQSTSSLHSVSMNSSLVIIDHSSHRVRNNSRPDRIKSLCEEKHTDENLKSSHHSETHRPHEAADIFTQRLYLWGFYRRHMSDAGVEPASCYQKVAGSIPPVYMSKCPWMRYWTTICSWCAGRHHQCVNVFMNYCQSLWTEASDNRPTESVHANTVSSAATPKSPAATFTGFTSVWFGLVWFSLVYFTLVWSGCFSTYENTKTW